MSSPFKTQEHLIAAWLEPFTAHTRRTYQTDLHRFQSTLRLPLKDVTTDDLARFQDTLRDLHPRSQIRIMATLSSLFRFGYRERFLSYDPTRSLRPVKLPVLSQPRWLSQAEVAALTADATPRNQVLLRMLADTGLTVGEVCQLKWDQVNLEGKPEPYVEVTSTRGVTRQLPLSSEVISALRTMREGRRPTDVVFLSSRSSPLHASQVFRIVRDAGRQAHLPEEISPYWLRHSYARRALANGMTLSELQYRLGHQTPQPTLGYVGWLTEAPGTPSRQSDRTGPSRHGPLDDYGSSLASS